MSRRSITARTTRGYSWMLAQTVTSQVVGLGGFVALGWLLDREDFGVYAMAQTVATAASLVRQVGVRAIVVNRIRRYRSWANPAFWLCGFLGAIAAGAMLVAAPFVARLYDAPDVALLVQVLSAAALLSALTIVPEAKLQAEMRFRLLAGIELTQVAGAMLATVLLAWAGLGALAFVLPRPILRLLQLVITLRAARPRLRPRPQLRRWRWLVGDSLRLLVANGSTYAMSQLDYVVLGIFHAQPVVGLYFYAFALSQRAIVLLTFNLRKVLFPALSSLQHEPARQVAGFMRATRLLVLIGAPACFLQAALAAPLVDLVLDEQWRDAVLLVQVLSIGSLFRLAGMPAGSLLTAQSRYGTLMRLGVATSVVFLVFVAVGATIGAATSTAVAVALAMAIIGPTQILVAVRPGGRTPGDVLRLFALPVAASAAAIVPPWALAARLPDEPWAPWVHLVAVPGIAVPVYVALAAWLMPDDARDLLGRVRDLLRRSGRHGGRGRDAERPRPGDATESPDA